MRRAVLVLALVVVLAVGAVGAFVLYRKHQSRNVRGSSSVEFVTTQAAPAKRTPLELKIVPWPLFGYTPSGTRFADGIRVRPPFRRLWLSGGDTLLEFPPAIAYGRLYIVNAYGAVAGLNTRTGKRAWKFEGHRCAASSPAVSKILHGTVYVTLLNRSGCGGNKIGDGELVALKHNWGQVRWRKQIGPSESSPLVVGDTVYVGDWRGYVYAFDAATGKLRWRYKTGDRIKGGVTYSAGRVFVGSYDHHVYALNARTGTLIWRASAQLRLGSQGTFYSTPAVAYGRVYIGATDGKVYSFGAQSGKLRWARGTGGYVYGSPAIWKQRVLVGSYSGRFYALDAATGDVRWTFDAAGPISGSATVIDGVVYFATLKGRTYGLDAATGKQVWTFPDGRYSPVVADKQRLYLVGYAKVYAFEPRARSSK
ncbi:MAG TPA: PQQ-binding-like beta-propeller repeat protein [Gaiellaceae bacterium]